MVFVFPIISSLIALVAVGWLAQRSMNISMHNAKVSAATGAIKVAAKACLARQYKIIVVAACIVFVLLFLFLGYKVALGFLVGSVASAVAGYIGILVAVSANGPIAERAEKGVLPAFQLSFQSGAVTGMLVVGLGLFVLTVFYWITKDVHALIGLALGGSLISVFARLGGGIFTKAVDVGARLVEKLELGSSDGGLRNPAVIVENVGGTIGECAGMAADMFETYIASALSAMLLGSLLFPGVSSAVIFPLAVGGVGIIASLLSVAIVILARFSSATKSLYLAVAGAAALSMAFLVPITNLMMPSDTFHISPWRLYGATLAGLFVVVGMLGITDYYTSKKFRPVRSIARASVSGHGTNLIAGIAMGYEATVLPVLLISSAILVSYQIAGIYGIALAAMGTLSLAGVIIAVNAFGPIADNARNIAQTAGLSEETRKVTDLLDATGNATKAITRGYAIGSVGLAAVVLFISYKQELENVLGGVREHLFSLDNPYVLIGLFMGGLVAYLFSALIINSVGRVATSVVEEMRRQSKETPGVMEGTEKPDYLRITNIITGNAMRAMAVPALLPILFPILVGFLLGPEALGGLLVGGIITGLFLAISMTSGGAALDNARKYIEEGHFGGKGSEAYKVAVMGDTVGDPYKDTAGPAISSMLKPLTLVALLIVGFLR